MVIRILLELSEIQIQIYNAFLGITNRNPFFGQIIIPG